MLQPQEQEMLNQLKQHYFCMKGNTADIEQN